MFAPHSYTVRKYPLKFVIDREFSLPLTEEEDQKYRVKQQDNLLFRQLRRITKDEDTLQNYLLFINCKGGKSYEKSLRRLVRDGVTLGSRHFRLSERSASMTRSSILSFVDDTVADELERRITMDVTMETTVLSKYYAYRGLMLSSCHCLEDWYPKIVVMPDCVRTIPNQRIRYAFDQESTFTDKNGKERTWVQKDIGEDCRDITINVADGCGLHHPSISRQVQELLKNEAPLTSILWRGPFLKGVTHEIDYEAFYRDRGVTGITDLWGVRHDFSEPMILITESMYKGLPYFAGTHTAKDWAEYWRRFCKYEHCLGIARWNYTTEEEPVYTRANYQILQDLDLAYEDFAGLAGDSVRLIQHIQEGDPLYTYCYLGLTGPYAKGTNDYTRALLKNPEMLKETGVKQYVASLLEKSRNDLKCGKLWLKSTFKFLVPDPIFLLEHMGGLKTNGCLAADEFFSGGTSGPLSGEHLIERNPHICRSEHVILKGACPEPLQRYAGHLANTCIINAKSITAQRLNGADFDGDLVLVIDHPVMLRGVDRSVPIVLDTQDKATARKEADTPENRTELILRTMNNLIGETSNCATAYHNKMPKTEEQKKKYESYIDLLSIINGKAIDFAKTGVFYQIPRNIAKFGRPLPYFMKYAGDYYQGLSTFSHARSNLNRLCKELEKWEKTLRYPKQNTNFDYRIMIDPSLTAPVRISEQIEEIYLDFCRKMKELGKEQAMIRNYDQYEEDLSGWISREEARNFTINWQYYYEKYRARCEAVCPNPALLANICVGLSYEKYPGKNRKFLWRVAGKGVVKNIKQIDFPIPVEDPAGPYEYLGKRYQMELVSNHEEYPRA